MKAKQFTIVVFVALIGGLIGGILSSQMSSGRFAFAKDDKPLKVVRAESFELIDKNGTKRAYLYYDRDATFFVIGDDPRKHNVMISHHPIFGVALFIDSANDSSGASIRLHSGANGSSITLFDKKRTRLAIGRTELENPKTGSKEIRSEGSIVIFDKDGNIIRQMP